MIVAVVAELSQVNASVSFAGGAIDCYYFDVSFAETLRRHATRPQATHFTAGGMRSWYAERDLLPGSIETVPHEGRGMRLGLVCLVVDDHDEAIAFFTGALGFDLVEDVPAVTNDGRPKRWVVVRPTGGGTGLLLARADGERQRSAVGDQVAGRVGVEPYGVVAVFRDVAGNLWDLRGPAPADPGKLDPAAQE